ncbi:MAG: Jag N-terminal domain-containing protein [Desulfobulbaceae bacterium]|nr:Jag N-terminal domain-containing protein [Desulfobulbaceae bacterium]
MSAKMEYTGNDVADAIKTACKKLNATQDQIEIEIKSAGSSGIFGIGRRKAKIMVSLKNSPGDKAANDSRKGASARNSSKSKPSRDGREARPPREPAKPLSADAIELIRKDLLQILVLMDAPSTVEVEQTNGKLTMHIKSDHLEQIIGPSGQTLDSIQYLLRKMAGKKMTERVQVNLDAGDFRESRVKELQATAERLAGEVRDNGRTKSIPSLNPAERRIVHMILQNDTTIRSRSVGDGLYKKVLIYLPGKGRKRNNKNTRASNPLDNQEQQNTTS